ncbi:LPS export ABC transporter periplasmic protein LptC [Campylobacter mucosalis]|uniref:LPS export ABC transporter periplasmic protein LptC n=1 Tax=Campylobacter mucosalis TaxID=202 RepID=UPI00147053A5|nr:LPS export ABC transporter periplasmic protein LptC [Campylobacter mucosalis]
MVIKIFYFVITIFSVTFIFLLSSDPYFADTFKQDFKVSNTQANDVVDYEISATKVVSVYEADEMNRYADFDEALKFKSTSLRGLQQHFMSSDKAILQGDEIKFISNAKYKNNESLKFSSEEMIYNKKTKIIRSDVPFEILRDTNRAIGQSIEYDTQKKQMRAKEIKAWVEQDK